MSKQHKSISASDVLKALEIIEFGDINDTLSAELQSMYVSIFVLYKINYDTYNHSLPQ